MTDQEIFYAICRAFGIGLLSGMAIGIIAWTAGSYAAWVNRQQRKERNGKQ